MTTVFRSEGHTGLSEVSSKHIQPHRGNLLKKESNVMSVTWWKHLPTIRSCPISAWKELLGKLAGPGPACESGMHLKFRWFRPKLWSQYKWKIRTNLITKKEYMRNADRPCWLALACSRSLEKGSALWITSLTWLFLSFFEHSLRKRINFRTSTSEDFTGRPAAFIEADGDYGLQVGGAHRAIRSIF